ncbi:hypothetical protein PGT21_020224 [Puccinia graminis f. sp. tritici]|uniref:Uncharacterized protein n=1 Tax=Puccinia graminis f. sp. tritici TaxID=56615 RepID=A0A5B0PH54_PUCGR|nr:hypothetical protein PGT21_020224 [Puccinia graminis f. sp. tritici]
MDASMIAELQAGLAQRDALITQLLNRVSAMELNNASKAPEGSKKKSTSAGAAQSGSGETSKKKMSNKAGKKKATTTPTPTSKAVPKPPTNLGSATKTPVKQRARSATPASASKKSPLQMVKQDHPEGFEHTKVLWGLIKKRAVPNTPSPEQLATFYQRFSSTEQIQSAVTGGPNLVALEMINTLKEAREKRMKLGKHIVNISDFHIQYIHTSLSQLGLFAWNPNLNEQADSLYNEAHKICAIRSFRQMVAGGAYQYMNVNATYVDNFDLLKQTYDHYVHYVLAKIFDKEKKEQGKHFRDEERKVLQTARERLREKRYKFAVNNNFPKQYLEIIKCVQAHSDDEFYPSKSVYIVKKLPFRSRSADIFFRRLNEVMKQSSLEEGRRDQSRRRIRVKDAPNTVFPKAPKGLPIDFYDAEWFNEKLPAQRQNLANIDAVAFLSNPNDSLRFKDPIEKLSNKRFAEERWDDATKPYNMDFLTPKEQDSDSDDEDGDSDYGESIDLEKTDGEDDDEEEEEEEEEEEDADDDVNMRGEADENFEEFDDPEADMKMEHYGKGSYLGGLNDEEWNTWHTAFS